MEAESQRPKDREDAILALNTAIKVLDLAEKALTTIPAKAVFASVSVLLATIRDSMADRLDYVELGLSCAGVCRVLDREISGKRPDELTRSVYDAIMQFTLTVADIQRKLVKWGQRNAVSRRLHAESDKETIATWRLDFDKILRAFNGLGMNTDVTDFAVRHDVPDTHTIVSGVRNTVTNTSNIVSGNHSNASRSPGDTGGRGGMDHAVAPEESPPLLPRSTHGAVSEIHHDVMKTLAIVSELEHNATSTHIMISDIHRTMVKGQGGNDSKYPSTQTSTLGESPPPPPRAFFGRGELIEKIVCLAENLTPTALIGPGGIGKTSVALTVLHHDRIKQRFSDNRRFIRCDQFPPTLAHFLRRLSKVIGAGVENLEDIIPLRPFLSSREMFIIIDNAESILDPRGQNAREIYAAVEELSQFKTVSLCITSRITTVPRDCQHPTIPMLSMEAASDIFYGICSGGGRSGIISDLLRRLDFHALSTVLLATTASHNMWDHDRLAQEWDKRRTNILRTDYNESLAATIELSLTSPTFRELGPDARDLLGVTAFFPQGIDENNLDWLFPTIPERKDIFDKLCVLSLTRRSNGFITMLAPLRDYLSPKDPKSSPLLRTTKDRYFRRLSVDIDPDRPGFEEARWIVSEDVNVEHLLDVFTSIDASSIDVWDVCGYFMQHLYWHKMQLVMLGPKIEGLPDDHGSKPECLFQLSLLFGCVGNDVEYRRLLVYALKLWRERGNDVRVARTLTFLVDANRLLGLHDEGIQQAKEALEVYIRLGDMAGQAQCLVYLAQLLDSQGQLDAAEEAASRAFDLVPGRGEQFLVCQFHRVLANIYRSKGETVKAIHHYQVAFGIASSFDWNGQLFWVHYSLAGLFRGEGRFDDANLHINRAKSHAVNSTYYLGHAIKLQARVWYEQDRLEDARSEALRAADVYKKLGAVKGMEECKELLQDIRGKRNSPVASG